MIKKIQYNTPIKLGILYSIITILLYEFGPFNFPDKNKIELYIFLFMCNAAMYFGFCHGTLNRYSFRQDRNIRINKYLNILFWISLIICVPKFMMSTGIYNNVVSNIIIRVSMYSDMARELYMDRQDLVNVTGIWKLINIVVVLLGPFYWAYLNLSMLLWNRLGFLKKVFTIFIWFIYVGQYLCTGTNVGVFHFMISLGVIYIIRKRKEVNIKKQSRFSKLRFALVGAIVIVSFLAFFNVTMESRKGATYERELNSNVCGYTCPVDHNSILYIMTPPPLHPLLFTATSYVAKPYAALSFAFDMPFQTTGGVGYSWFLLDNSPGSSFLWNRTFPMQLEKEYSYSSWVNWHTAYTWFANDVSWFGVPFVLFYLFRLFGKSWRRYVEKGDLLSFLMFMLFVRFILFVSMNNQVFQQSETFFAFWLLVFFRLFSKHSNWVA